MENAPSPEITKQEIRDRLAAIDQELLALSDSLDGASKEFEEGSSIDDNSSEGELLTQKLAGIDEKRKELAHERDALHERLAVFQKTA